MYMHGYGSLSFFSILWFFVWLLWAFLLIRVLSDVFLSPDLGGGAKAVWTLLLIVFPFLGVLAYLLMRGSDMHTREARYGAAAHLLAQHYPQPAGLTAPSAADEIIKLASLRDQGLLTDGEFEAEKSRVLV